MLEFNTVVVVSPNLGKFRQIDLDTVLLVSSIRAQQPAALRLWFVAGASVASLFWFCLLGFGARWLAPWFAGPKAWQLLMA
jgi:L-lysine exporter family protein LysE/ArgO